jgi:putative addiction module component (TIGR02574 family)
MSRVEELVEQVRSLSPDEQEAFRILLDAETTDDFELSPEWKAEIQRRIEDIDSGRVKTIPWEEVRDRLRERIRAHKD